MTTSEETGTGMTPLAEAANELHEMFRTLIDSGFTEWQACRVIGVMLAEQGRQQ
jgi:hypothetical protein